MNGSFSVIKPNLKCTQFGKYKKEYEDKIAIAEVKWHLQPISEIKLTFSGQHRHGHC